MKLYRMVALFVTLMMVLSAVAVPGAPALAAPALPAEAAQPQASLAQPPQAQSLRVEDLPTLTLSAAGPITPACTTCDPTTTLAVTKTADDPDINAGDPIGYTITVTNTGSSKAVNVFIDDGYLPTGTTWHVDDPACTISGSQLTCTYPELAAGSSVSVHVYATSTVAMCGTVQNKSYAKADNAQLTLSFWSYIKINCPVTQPDLKVTKAAENSTVYPGEAARFTITVSNDGDGAAENVRLNDPLPQTDVLAWVIDTGANGDQCAITEGVLACSFGVLPPGESRSVIISALVPDDRCAVDPSLEISNTATATADNEDPAQSEDNFDTATIHLNCTSLLLTKTADAPSIEPGETLGFVLTVTNTGDAVATGVTLEDPLDSSLTWTADNPACAIDAAGLMTCDFGDLAPDQSATVHITAPTTAAVCAAGTIENTAVVTANNLIQEVRATADVTIDCSPNLTVTKTAADRSVFPGERAIFTITVENIGNGPAANTTLQDLLPPALIWVVDSNSEGAECAITAGVLDCSFGDLAPGAVASVTVSAPTTVQTCGSTITNSATATTTGEDVEDLPNNTDSDEITLACPTFQVTKVAVTPVVGPDDLITFDISVINGSGGAISGVTLTDPIGFGANWQATNPAQCAIDEDNTLTCDFGDMAAGAVAQVSITGESTVDMCGEQWENTATASATGLAPVFGSDTVNVVCDPDVAITKTAVQASVGIGQNARFSITVSNAGAGTATGVLVNDPLPNPTLFAWTIATPVEGCSITGGVLTCEFATLNAGESRVIELTAPVSSGNCTTQITNTATVSADDEPADSMENNTSSATIDLNCNTLQILKEAVNPVVGLGELVSFDITVTNTGDAALTNVVVSDQLDPSFEWSVDNTTACTLVEGLLECTFAEIPAGESTTVRITTQTVTTEEECNTVVSNTASAIADGQTLVLSSATVNINCGVPDVAVIKTAEQPLLFLNIANPEEVARFNITVTNIGEGDAVDVTLTDTLPAPVYDPAATLPDLLTWSIDITGDGADCQITGGQLTCDFGTLQANESRVVSVSAPVNFLELEETLGEDPYVIGYNNTAAVTAVNETPGDNNQSSARLQIFYSNEMDYLCYRPELVYQSDFETTPTGTATWTNARDSRVDMWMALNEVFLGGYARDDRAIIEFTPPERQFLVDSGSYFIEVKFDFYALGSLDGNSSPGPDHFRLEQLNGEDEVEKLLLDYTFSNFDDRPEWIEAYPQSYPGRWPYFRFTPRTGATAIDTIGFFYLWGTRDSVYSLTAYLPMTNDPVRLGFRSLGMQELEDEGWGIDNLQINTCVYRPQPLLTNSLWLPLLPYTSEYIGFSPVVAPSTPSLPLDDKR